MAIKFALKLKGVYVRSIDGLREYFSENEILEVYKDKRLLRWLDVWEYHELKNQVEDIKEVDNDKIVSALYDIFEIESFSNSNAEEFFENALNCYYVSNYEASLKSFQEYFKLDYSNSYNLDECKEKIKYYEDIIEELLIKIIEKNNIMDSSNNEFQEFKELEDEIEKEVEELEQVEEELERELQEVQDELEVLEQTIEVIEELEVVEDDLTKKDEVLQEGEFNKEELEQEDEVVSPTIEYMTITEEMQKQLELLEQDIENMNPLLLEDEEFIQNLEQPEQYLLLKESQKQLEAEMRAIKIQEVEKTKKPNVPRAFTKKDALNFQNSAKVVIPEGFNAIDEEAFYENNTVLREIIIPNTVTSIGDYAFKWCKNLIDIVIPSSVIFIGSYAFYGCINLIKLTILEGITYIGDEAFSYCNNLQEVIIPDSVTYIGNEAFFECGNLKKVTLSRNTKIEENTFNYNNTKIVYKI